MATYSRTGRKYFLERPRRRAQLIRLLADGNHSQTAIARFLDVTPGAITMFKARHQEEIQAMRRGIAEKTDHLWIASRANRLTALDQTYSDIQDFKAQRMATQIAARLQGQPSSSLEPDQTHGYEQIDFKQVGGAVVEIHKFDAGLANTELKIIQQAENMAEDRAQTPLPPALTQNNLTVNLFDRASVLRALNEGRP